MVRGVEPLVCGCGGGFGRSSVGGLVVEFVETSFESTGDFGGFAEDAGEDHVAGNGFCETGIGFEAEAFELSDFFVVEGAVEVFGHPVGIGQGAFGFEPGGFHSRLLDDGADSLDELLGVFAFRDLGFQLSGFGGGKNAIQVGHECSECESHGWVPGWGLV